MAKAAEQSPDSGNVYTLASVREDLVRQEDTIIYGLIERAKFPSNPHTYDEEYAQIQGFCGSLVEFVVKNTEAIQAKVLFVINIPYSLLVCFLVLLCVGMSDYVTIMVL